MVWANLNFAFSLKREISFYIIILFLADKLSFKVIYEKSIKNIQIHVNICSLSVSGQCWHGWGGEEGWRETSGHQPRWGAEGIQFGGPQEDPAHLRPFSCQ